MDVECAKEVSSKFKMIPWQKIVFGSKCSVRDRDLRVCETRTEMQSAVRTGSKGGLPMTDGGKHSVSIPTSMF